MNHPPHYPDGMRERVLKIMLRTNGRFFAAAVLPALGVLAAAYAYSRQLGEGIGVSGKGSPVMWGFYITNFLFWTGLSHAGILVSASFRLTRRPWCRLLARPADATALAAFAVGAVFPIVHLGRPDRFFWMVPFPNDRMFYPNFRSPLVWDFLGLNSFLIISLLYIGFYLRPDLGIIRDGLTGWKHALYAIPSWSRHRGDSSGPGSGRLIAGFPILMVLLAAGAEVIVSMVFSSTLNPGWDNPLLGLYFIVGAALSGVAAMILVLAFLRFQIGLQAEIQLFHIDRLCALMRGLGALWAFLTLLDNYILYQRGGATDLAIFWSKVNGRYSPLFWLMILLSAAVPIAARPLSITRTIKGAAIVSAGVMIGIWLERFLLIVPTLAQPRLSYVRGGYSPTWVEGTITAGTFAGFALLIMLFSSLFPILSVWEAERDRREGPDEVARP